MPRVASRLIYITDFWTGAPDVEQAAVGDAARVITLAAEHEHELLPRVGDAAALLVWHEIRLSAATIDALRACRAIVRVGVGFDNVDLEAARRRNIPVCNVPDYGTEDVADHALALMLALVRNLPEFAADLRGDRDTGVMMWNARRCRRTPRLRGLTLGIVGLGRIGSATALRAKAFGMEIVAFDPYIADGHDKALGVRRAESLPELLAQCDVVSLHTPLTPETNGMIHAGTLRSFKPGAILINTARGPICDTTAVLAALDSGALAGAGLDVLPTEPPAADDPLVAAHRTPGHIASYRCILTPHSAFYTEEGFAEMRRKAALEARRAITGERLRNCVNGVGQR